MSKKARIIGAGISGLLTGLLLMRHGWKVTLLKQNTLALVLPPEQLLEFDSSFPTPQTVLGMRYCVDFYSNFNDVIGGNIFQSSIMVIFFCSTTKLKRQKPEFKCNKELVFLTLSFWMLLRQPSVFLSWIKDLIKGSTWCPS